MNRGYPIVPLEQKSDMALVISYALKGLENYQPKVRTRQCILLSKGIKEHGRTLYSKEADFRNDDTVLLSVCNVLVGCSGHMHLLLALK